MARHSRQKPRQLSDQVLAGFERRLESADIPAAKLPEIIQLRAIGRELIGHINFMEEAHHRMN